MCSVWKQEMDSLIGEWVEVTYSTDPPLKQVGRLVSYTEDGELEVRDKYAITHYIWPNLEIKKHE